MTELAIIIATEYEHTIGPNDTFVFRGRGKILRMADDPPENLAGFINEWRRLGVAFAIFPTSHEES